MFPEFPTNEYVSNSLAVVSYVESTFPVNESASANSSSPAT